MKLIRISGAAIRMLAEYNWPGNVRELGNVIERAVIFCKGKEIILDNLPEHIKKASKKKVVPTKQCRFRNIVLSCFANT